MSSSCTPSWIPDSIELARHPIGRNKCVARNFIKGGSSILKSPSISTILLESEKGQRCDNCFRLSRDGFSLKRCTGCGSYWYCDTNCQSIQWEKHHKRICKSVNSLISSTEYQALADHQKLDSMLLSHLVAHLSLQEKPYSVENLSSGSIFLSLLPFPEDSILAPVLCPIKPTPPVQLIRRLYARFGNNNFVIHSHLTSVGHGIFPLASRLFNHSCVPNAAVKYIFSSTECVVLDVIALRDIQHGEEIYIPYVDPALLQSRTQMLELSYGFTCDCSSCSFLHQIGPIPELPADLSGILSTEVQLRKFIELNSSLDPKLPTLPLATETIPPSLYCVFRESYITNLSEKFRKDSHEGNYGAAFESGQALLSLYCLIYPENYPQIGMHLLELSKTIWNSGVSSPESSKQESQMLENQTRLFLTLARQVLTIFGAEGDEGGPLEEINTLERLISID